MVAMVSQSCKCPFENVAVRQIGAVSGPHERTWPQEYRECQKAFERQRYLTNLTDEEWERIRPILRRPARRGRKPKVNLHEMLNAIRYLARTGRDWRMLPHEFGP